MSHSSRNILEIFGFLIEICHLLQVQTSLTTAQHTTQLGSNIIASKSVCGIFHVMQSCSIFKIKCIILMNKKYRY